MAEFTGPKILVADDEPDLLEILTFMLEMEFKARVITAISGEAAIAILKSQPDFDAVICDFNMPNGTGADVQNFITEKKLLVPFILSTADFPESEKTFARIPAAKLLHKPYSRKTLVDALQTLPGFPTPHSKSASQYCRVNIGTLLRIGLLYQDLFVHLGSDKYVKIMKSGDAFELDDAKRFSLKEVDYLYIARTDADKFLSTYLRNLTPIIAAKEMPIEARITLSQGTLELVYDVSRTFGWTEDLQTVVNHTIELVVKSVSQEPALHDIFQRAMLNPNAYLAAHSSALAFISCGIAQSMNWSSDFTYYKLTLASFLHDACLEVSTLAQIEKLEAARTTDPTLVSDSELRAYLDHPQKMSLVAKEWPKCPPDLDTVISQHHERPDGTGFPFGVTQARIHPLAALLIISEDLVDYCLRTGSKRNFSDFLHDRAELYSAGHFRKIFQTLTTRFRK